MRVGSFLRVLQLSLIMMVIVCLLGVRRIDLREGEVGSSREHSLTVHFYDSQETIVFSETNTSTKHTTIQVPPKYFLTLSTSDIFGVGTRELFERTKPVLASSLLEAADLILVALVAIYGELNEGKLRKSIHVVICILRVILELCAFSSLLTHRLEWERMWQATNVTPIYPPDWICAMMMLMVMSVLTVFEPCVRSLLTHSIRLQSPEPPSPVVSCRLYQPVQSMAVLGGGVGRISTSPSASVTYRRMDGGSPHPYFDPIH